MRKNRNTWNSDDFRQNIPSDDGYDTMGDDFEEYDSAEAEGDRWDDDLDKNGKDSLNKNPNGSRNKNRNGGRDRSWEETLDERWEEALDESHSRDDSREVARNDSWEDMLDESHSREVARNDSWEDILDENHSRDDSWEDMLDESHSRDDSRKGHLADEIFTDTEAYAGVYDAPDILSYDEDGEQTDQKTEREERRRQKAYRKELKEKNRRQETEKKPKTGKNREIMVVMYAFLVIFAACIAYFIYFDAVESKTVITYSGNVHLAAVQDTIARGSILASDGTVLAETVTDEDGNETRNYPFANVFAHVVGTSEINKSGLEYSFDSELSASSLNAISKTIYSLKNEKSPGDQVVTTLDADLQQAAYDALGDNDGVVIVLEPDTGRVLAMVSKPDYDPNTLEEDYEEIVADEDSKVLLNQATYGLFTPGSIFKIVTALEYIRENEDYSSYSYVCQGSITLSTSSGGTQSLSCSHSTSHGTVDLITSFAKSCNSSFANLGTTLDTDSFADLASMLLFNQSLPTSIGHYASTFSISSDDSEWLIGATAIGQGYTTMTPLHAAMIVSAIANDGVLMEPYLVDSVQSAEGTVITQYSSETYGNLMTAEEAELLTEMMLEVTTSGTASALSSLSYSVAGKTGTAEIDDEEDTNNAWFIGFAPAEDPEIVVVVLVEDTSLTSSKVAVPIAEEIFEAYLGE